MSTITSTSMPAIPRTLEANNPVVEGIATRLVWEWGIIGHMDVVWALLMTLPHRIPVLTTCGINTHTPFIPCFPLHAMAMSVNGRPAHMYHSKRGQTTQIFSSINSCCCSIQQLIKWAHNDTLHSALPLATSVAIKCIDRYFPNKDNSVNKLHN